MKPVAMTVDAPYGIVANAPSLCQARTSPVGWTMISSARPSSSRSANLTRSGWAASSATRVAMVTVPLNGIDAKPPTLRVARISPFDSIVMRSFLPSSSRSAKRVRVGSAPVAMVADAP